MAKNIVICCDGTGNEINANLSNVLKLFRVEAIAAATDKDYDVLRDMAKVLQLDIAKL